MRKTISLLALTALAACSQESDSPPDGTASDQPLPRTAFSAEEAPTAPGIAPTAAPGVAFNYRYAFRLPSERIAQIQEQHAAACEKLGIDRCRITGMRYRLINDRDIEAMLAFKLDPALARQFGKQGIDTVAAADGMLVDSEISGKDVGSEISATDRGTAQVREDLERVERQLGKAGLKSSERVELQAQAERLRQTLRADRATQADRRDSLASTPVVFRYGSGDLAPGFDTRPSVQAALERAGENFMNGVSLLIVILITLLPWGVAIALLVWLYRRFIRRRWPALGAAASQE